MPFVLVHWSDDWGNELHRGKMDAFNNAGMWVKVEVPFGMSERQFDRAVLRAADYVSQQVEGKRYRFTGGSNSNRFVYDIITRAGGYVPGTLKLRFPLGAPGLCGGIWDSSGFNLTFPP